MPEQTLAVEARTSTCGPVHGHEAYSGPWHFNQLEFMLLDFDERFDHSYSL